MKALQLLIMRTLQAAHVRKSETNPANSDAMMEQMRGESETKPTWRDVKKLSNIREQKMC